MEEDEEFANQLQELLAQMGAAGVVRQVAASGIEVAGDLEAEDMSQKSSHSSSVDQEIRDADQCESEKHPVREFVVGELTA